MIQTTKTSRSSYQIKMNIPKSCENLIKYRKKGIYKLYWLRHKNHTNIKTQGYIGITGKSLRERMNQHAISSEDGVDYPVYNAIRKHKDDIIVDVLAIGDEDYILGLEESLRPDIYIGWNIDVGGSGTNSKTMKYIWSTYKGDIWRQEKIERHKNNPELVKNLHKGAQEFRENGGIEILRERTSEQWKDPNKRKFREAANRRAGKSKTEHYKKVGNWLSSKTNHYVWENAKTLYDVFMEDPNVSRGKFAKKTGYTQNEIDCIHRKYFKKGWNPYEDEKWLEFYEGGLRDKYGK